MYIDSTTSQGKYVRHLLRESFREDGKVKHRTIANISQCSEEEIEAIRLALKHKGNLAGLIENARGRLRGRGRSSGLLQAGAFGRGRVAGL